MDHLNTSEDIDHSLNTNHDMDSQKVVGDRTMDLVPEYLHTDSRHQSPKPWALSPKP